MANNTTNNEALKSLLFAMADDLLILGHRNSEWTGLGPILEEDIAFSSMAQDKIGQSLSLYTLLHEHCGEEDPDMIAFLRNEKEFRCCHLVEYPIGEYDFSLMRHFLFDFATYLRFQMLEQSGFEPLAQLARKFHGEIKYHVMHANTWIVQLGQGTEESHAHMQSALNETFNLALGIFEPLEHGPELATAGVFEGEEVLQERWLETITSILAQAQLQVPDLASASPVYGGRKGYHTEFLAPLIEEMGEVLRMDPAAEW